MPRPANTVYLQAALVALASGPSTASEPVTVYLKPPAAITEQRNLEAVLRALPAQKSKWNAYTAGTLTYVVAQREVGLFKPDPCDGLPIRVQISHGRFQNAYYEASGGKCRKGHVASRTSPAGQPLYLTPDDLFRRIANAETELRCYRQTGPSGCLATSLWVTYDEKLGIPTKLEDYSVLVHDHYWSLEVTEISLKP